MAELEYGTYWHVWCEEEDPGDEGYVRDLDDVIRAGVEALGLQGAYRVVEVSLEDCGRGMW